MPFNPRLKYEMPNSSPELAAKCVDVMKRYQDLGADIERLREHLRSPDKKSGTAARIAACELAAASLSQAVCRMLITALVQEIG